MRNLKRALSLALAAIMLVGMMVVGAGAVSLDDFSDKADIVNKDAVSLLTTLGIINGKEDGSFFDPNGNVTRAEMAKMISVILNKGADNNDLYTGATSNLTDVKGHWAEGHINYCSSLGIIAGRGDNKFDPGADVTASEAAKMLLVAVGYDAAIEGFVGGDWAVNVNAKAASLGIFNDFNKNVTAPLNRDDAALLIYNALDVERIQQYSGNYALVYNDRRTVLGEMYGVYKLKGVVTGNEWAQLDETDYDERLADGKTRVDNPTVFTSNTLGTNTGDSTSSNNNQADIKLGKTQIFNVSTPVEYLGQTVTMYVRKTTVLNDYEVLGVQLREDDNTVIKTAEIISTTPSENVFKTLLKGTGLVVKTGDAAPEYYVNYGIKAGRDDANAKLMINPAKQIKELVEGGNIIDNKYGIELTIIDNNKDGVVDYVLWLQEDLTKLTALNKTKDYVTFMSDSYKPDLTGYNRGRTIDMDDVVFVDDAEEGDIVLVRTYGGRYYVSKPDVVTGKMESYSAKKTAEQYIVVDGETYHASFINTTAGGQVDNMYTFDVADCANKEDDGVQWDITYDFYMDSNGHIAAFMPSEKLVPNYALVLESGYDPGVYSSDASGKVTVLLADGTEGTYPLNFSASARNLADQIEAYNDAHEGHEIGGNLEYDATKRVKELKGFLGTDYTDTSDSKPWTGSVDSNFVFAGKNLDGNGTSTSAVTTDDYKHSVAAGYVITYTLNSDDVLTIQSVVGTYDSSRPGATLGSFVSGVVNTQYKSGDAVVKHADGQNALGKYNTAVDLDTIAFYYEDADNYGVAIGYKDMSDTAAGNDTQFVGTNVGARYNDGAYRANSGTNLAEMLLFNCKGKEATKNFVYILNRNDHYESGKYVTLYGVLEDGKAVTMKVERDNWEEVKLNSLDSKYEDVFEYTTNASGITKLSDPDDPRQSEQVLVGYALRLTNGTVAFKAYNDGLPGQGGNDTLPTNKDYTNSYALAKADQVWDVTNIEEEVDAPAGAFSTSVAKHAIIILDKKTGGTKINAAYVWDIDPDDLNANAGVTLAGPSTAVEGASVTLTATATGTSPFTYEWILNNAKVDGETGASITLAGNQLKKGANTIKVIVTDNAGKSDSATKTVTVNEAADGLTLNLSGFTTPTVAKNSVTVSPFTGGMYLNFAEGDKVLIGGSATELPAGSYWKVTGIAEPVKVTTAGLLSFTMPGESVTLTKATDEFVKYVMGEGVSITTGTAADKIGDYVKANTQVTVDVADGKGTGVIVSASANTKYAGTAANIMEKGMAKGNFTPANTVHGDIYLIPAATLTAAGLTINTPASASSGDWIKVGEAVKITGTTNRGTDLKTLELTPAVADATITPTATDADGNVTAAATAEFNMPGKNITSVAEAAYTAPLIP